MVAFKTDSTCINYDDDDDFTCTMRLSADHYHPTPKELNVVVRMYGVATRWYSLGLELLDNNSILDMIRLNNQGDVECCCNEMFKTWPEMRPDASWNQLIEVLIKLDLKTTASNIN